jgi:primosomal protein N'
VLISSSDETKALESTKKVYEDLNKIYQENRDKFFFFGCMKAPLKKLQGKFRYQVLMRIDCKEVNLIDKIYFEAEKYNDRNTLVFVEKNPNNLS